MFRLLYLCFICTSVSAVNYEIIKSWSDFPAKLLLNESVISPQCYEAQMKMLADADNNNLNALKMLDASAKLPAGLLSGNINQFGDFDECLSVATAQYCLIDLDLSTSAFKHYHSYKHLLHSYYFFKDTFSDPPHRIPGFSTNRWGFCIPKQCSGNDVVQSLKHNLGVSAQVRPNMCQQRTKSKTATFGDYVTKAFFTSVMIIVVLSACNDYFSKTNWPYPGFVRIVNAFSIKKNVATLLEINERASELSCLHGIRALNALALYLCHKSVSLLFNPYTNRTDAIEELSKPWTIIGKNAIVYTDVFMLISGFLNAGALFRDLQTLKKIQLKTRVLNRIIRLLPNLVSVILFSTYILPSMGSGPLWPIVIEYHADLCTKNMWRNIFFIHNYFGFETMCLTHTHQIGIDLQLFLITPLLVHIIWKNHKIGLWTLLVGSIISTMLRFYTSYTSEVSSVIYFGIPVSKMFAISSLSYILPTHRATIYFIGVYLAYFLAFVKNQFHPTKTQLTLLWCFFLTCFFLSWLGPVNMVDINFQPKKLQIALISGLYPILWGPSIAFAIYRISEHSAGWLEQVFCWRYFQIFTRISYSFYLVQFPIFFYNVGLTRQPTQYSASLLLQFYETTQVLIVSIILVLFIELPFQNLGKLYIAKPGHKRTSRQQSKTG